MIENGNDIPDRPYSPPDEEDMVCVRCGEIIHKGSKCADCIYEDAIAKMEDEDGNKI